MKKTSIVFSFILLVACAAPKFSTSLSNKDADRAAKKFPGITMVELNEGKNTFETKCGRCHSLEKSYRKPEEHLNKIVPVMSRKAKIDEKAGDLVLKYLVTINTRS